MKSGWAAAVLLSGPASAPQLLDRGIVELSDPAVPASRQPYHAGFGVAQRNLAKLRGLRALIARSARRSVTDLVRRHRAAGHGLRGVGVVIGSDIDPDRITNPHIRAHASEGRLFRTVLEQAVLRCGLRCTTLVERLLGDHASRVLGRPEADLKQALAELGRRLPGGGRWRAEEKAAALAAWVVLASRQR